MLRDSGSARDRGLNHWPAAKTVVHSGFLRFPRRASSGDGPTCEKEQMDPRSVNGCLGDGLKGQECSCLRVVQQPPPRNFAPRER